MEFVYVVKRADLFDLHFPQGFLPVSRHQDEITTWLDRARRRGFFIERRHAEEDSSLKQIIPYVVVRRADEVLLLQRSRKGGDARLHDKLSIGVGGHLNPPDAEHDDVVLAGARREIEEELTVADDVRLEPLGVINDDSNPVGSVHFGVVLEAKVRRGPVEVRERDVLQARFVRWDELCRLAADPAADLETWSRLLIQGLAESPG